MRNEHRSTSVQVTVAHPEIVVRDAQIANDDRGILNRWAGNQQRDYHMYICSERLTSM